MVMVRDILMYMDRTYVLQNKKMVVYGLGLRAFRETIARHADVKGRLQGLLLEAVRQERTGRLIEHALVKSTLYMLTDLGIDSNEVYEADFEATFLEETRRFYKAESVDYIATNTCPDYMRKVEDRLAEEAARVTNYLNPATGPKLQHIVETELISAHATTLVESERSGFDKLLHLNKMDDLRRMHDLFSRVPAKLDMLRTALYDHVKHVGLSLVASNGSPTTSSSSSSGASSSSSSLPSRPPPPPPSAPDGAEDAQAPAASGKNPPPPPSLPSTGGGSSPVDFLRALLELRDKYDAIVTQAFRAENSAQKRLKDAFESFINADSRCASCLVAYVDELMRSGFKGRSEAEVEVMLDKVVVIFRYLQDKDVFEAIYKAQLAKRLLNHRSLSHEAERQMLAKLKGECGYQYTAKLEGMFTDIKFSQDTMDVYKQTEPSKASRTESHFDLDVTMLTAGYWPMQKAPPCVLPALAKHHARPYEAFYLQHHTGRKLHWQTSAGTAELKATLTATSTYHLTVSTYQMCVLTLFNGDESTPPPATLSLPAMAEATRIPLVELKRHVVSLCTPKHRILVKQSKGKGIADDDVFYVNVAFSSKLKRVKVPLVASKDAAGTSDSDIGKNVEQGRRHLTEATLVRIMKARKSLRHNDLIAEVTRQLSARFHPQPQFIKKCIEALIEREYLERDAGDCRLYTYLA